MARTPLIVGNWKMELSHKAALELVRVLRKDLRKDASGVTVVLCPSYPALPAVAEAVKRLEGVAIGAQNVDIHERGAFTGQVAVMQIRGLADWCIVGHSEVRELTGESDEMVAAKAGLLLKQGLLPVVCIGETEAEREAGETIAKITRQIESLLAVLPLSGLIKTAIAYEPIWAIGSGRTPETDEVAEIALLIRKLITRRFDQEAAERVRILYGGSVTADNVESYVGWHSADGALVGGASIRPRQFVDIVKRIRACLQ